MEQGENGLLRVGDMVDLGDKGKRPVLDILRSKHTSPGPVPMNTLPAGNTEPPEVHPVVFDQITANSIHCGALRTKGATGPLGLYTHCWRRLCTTFKATSHDLCHALAIQEKRLCTTAMFIQGHLSLAGLLSYCFGQVPGSMRDTETNYCKGCPSFYQRRSTGCSCPKTTMSRSTSWY